MGMRPAKASATPKLRSPRKTTSNVAGAEVLYQPVQAQVDHGNSAHKPAGNGIGLLDNAQQSLHSVKTNW